MNILNHEKVTSNCNSDAGKSSFYEVVDILYIIEMDMNKVITAARAVTDATLIKSLNELNMVRDAK